MDAHVIRMPDLGEGIAEVELVAWRVQPGDAVAEDQVLVDVMTDKATVEIPSPVAGTVESLGGEVGESLAVGAELIRIALAGAGTPASGAAAGAPTPSAAPASEPARPAPRTRAAAAPSGATPPVAAAPSGAAPPQVDASPSDATPSVAAPPSGATPPAAAPWRPIASPAVRARAWELGVDLADVAASGSGGRIMQADLDAHVARGAPRAPTTPAPAPLHAATPPSAAAATQTVKVVGLRRKIAQKMQESKRRIPHFTYVEEVDVTELESLRAQLNATWGEHRGHLTLLPFLIRAIVLAAHAFPAVNARFDDEAGVVTRHAAVHVGIATQTDAGLMVPVLRDAQARDLWSTAAEVARLADAARRGKAVRDELAGSTITVTSLGPLGGIVSTPVINHPEVAIVGVNRIVLRPVVRDGAIVARQLMNLSSSFDHRVVDGAVAAAFVQRIRERLEHPATLFIR